MRNTLVVMVILGAIALLLALFAYTRPLARDTTPEDDEAQRIMTVCGVGLNESGRTSLSVGLARQLRQLQSETTISSARVGAILDKIGSDAIGRDTYDTYVRCLNQQMKFSLQARGVRIDAPTAAPSPGATVAAPVERTSTEREREQTPSPRKVAPTVGANNYEKAAPRAAASYETEGPCSPIIVGSTIGNISQNCE